MTDDAEREHVLLEAQWLMQEDMPRHAVMLAWMIKQWVELVRQHDSELADAMLSVSGRLHELGERLGGDDD